MKSFNLNAMAGLVLLCFSHVLFSQSREGMIQLELQNYVMKETLGEVVGEGELEDGVPAGRWEYYLIYDRNIKYSDGNYISGKKEGVWRNFALSLPLGYNDNYDLVRSTETYKDGLLYRYKMGQDNLLILIQEGLGEPYLSELKRLDESFENSYRRTHGKTHTPQFGETVESLQSRLIPMIRLQLTKSGKQSELKQWTITGKLKLHEKYDDGEVVYQLAQRWDNNILYSTEEYRYEILREKTLYMNGDPNNIIRYRYFEDGELEYMKHFKNDSIPIGKWIENYPGGKKKYQGSYVNGKRNGKWKFWDEDGNVEVVKYKDGEPAGGG